MQSSSSKGKTEPSQSAAAEVAQADVGTKKRKRSNNDEEPVAVEEPPVEVAIPRARDLKTELLRENVFDDGPNETPDGATDEERLVRREPTMIKRGKRLIAPSSKTAKKYTLVLDLDETVVFGREGPLYGRAYLKEFLEAVSQHMNVVVWTAGERDYAKTVLEEINTSHCIEHLIYRHKKWFNDEDYTKDLRLLGRDMDYVIMVDNTPDCVRENVENSIVVDDFEVIVESSEEESSQAASFATTTTTATNNNSSSSSSSCGATSANAESTASPTTPKLPRTRKDRTLVYLTELLLSLVASEQTVPTFLGECPLLKKQKVTTNDNREVTIYYLSGKRRRGPAKVPPGSPLTTAPDRSTCAEQESEEPKKEVKVNRDRKAESQAVVQS